MESNCFGFFKKIDFIFGSSFRFTAKLKRKYRDFPYAPCLHTHTQTELPSLSTSCARVMHLLQLVTCIDIIITQSPSFALGFTVDVVSSKSLGKYIMMCVYRSSMVQSGFTALKIFCAPPVYPSLPSTLLTTIFLWSPQFCLFQNVIRLESYNMQPYQIAFFHIVIFKVPCLSMT